MSVPESLLSKDKILHDYWYSSSESEESGDEIMDWFFDSIGHDDSESESTSSSETDSDNEATATINAESTSNNGKDGPQPVQRKKRHCPERSSSSQEWKDDPKAPPRQLDFASKRCVNVYSDRPIAPLTVLMAILGEDFFTKITRLTNLAAADHYDEPSDKRRPAPGAKWNKVTEDEMKLFFGLLLLMGLNARPSLDAYWSESPLLECPFIRAIMTLDRFQEILGSLEIDEAEHETDDVLSKIQGFADTILSPFRVLCLPGKRLSLEEDTYPFRGLLGFDLFNPKKRYEKLVKFYQVRDPVTLYCVNFKIEMGKLKNAKQLALDLMTDYLGRGHELYVGQNFTSVALFHELYLQRTAAVGICWKKHKEFPREIANQKLSNGHYLARRRGPVLALKWRKSRDFCMLSTKHSSAMQSFSANEPDLIKDFNDYTPLIDQRGPFVQLFCLKHIELWKKLFLHLFGLCIVNAHIIYHIHETEKDHPKRSMFEFIVSLVEDLIGYRETPDVD